MTPSPTLCRIIGRYKIMIKEYLTLHIATNKQLQIASGLSDRQVLRELKKLGDSVVKIMSGKSPRYALVVNAFGIGDSIPLWEVDIHGKHSCIAIIRPLSVGGFFVEKLVGGSNLLLGEANNGLYDDLPFFLRDMAPQGYLGRKIAKELARRDSGFPTNPELWNNSHIVQYLISNNDDELGDLKFGVSSNLRIKRAFNTSHPGEYPRLADDTMSDESPVSSAGGEQPKFTTFCTKRGAHVIVKFSPKGEGSSAKRWRDVLISEHYANMVLNTGATMAATTSLIELEGRLFLESVRFDRQGENGRCSMLSLKTIDAEFVGLGENWNNVLTALHKQDLLSFQDFHSGKFLWLCGRFINNSDMHLGNMSLAIHGDVFNLLPIYDMCSMGFAPKNNGEVMPFSFKEPELGHLDFDDEMVENAKLMAHKFWHLVLKDSRISDEFRDFLAEFLSVNPQASIF